MWTPFSRATGARDKHSSLLRKFLNCRQKSYNFGTQGQCYKTFFARNLYIFVISQSVCPWQAFPAQSNVCRQGRSLPELSTFQVLHSRVGSWPHPQVLDNVGIVCQGQPLQLITKILKLQTKKLCNLSPCTYFKNNYFELQFLKSKNSLFEKKQKLKIYYNLAIRYL